VSEQRADLQPDDAVEPDPVAAGPVAADPFEIAEQRPADLDLNLDLEPIELPEPPATGDAEVDDALRRLADLTGTPLQGHPVIYETVHRTLQDRLADVEG
jgi:hypothetical protein